MDRLTRHVLPVLALAMPASALAEAVTPGAPPKDMTVGDVATAPLSDVNLKQKEIPPLLEQVLEDPYAQDGLRKCKDIVAAVEELDAVLGPDFDTPAPESRGRKRRNKAMGLAKGAVTSFIPFRWLIREVTGANKAEDDYRVAIYAGGVRRAFLKGLGQQRGCKPPGAPYPLEVEQ